MAWTWPWRDSAGNEGARPEKKAAGGGFVAFHMQGDARWTRRDYAALSREGYMMNPVVYRTVRLIVEAAASVPWALREGGRDVLEHPLLALLERPNAEQAGGAFLEALYGHLLIAGNAYVELVRAGDDLTELHLLRPDRVAVVNDAAGWPQALEYRAASGKRVVPTGPLTAGSGGALQLSLFNPLDDHYGFPPLAAAQMALDTHNAAGRWNKALLDNSARPSGALVYAPKDGGNLSEEQFDRLKAELEDGYQGAARAGRPMLLEGGLDWKAMGLTPKDMDFIEAKNAASRDIALAFGVPPMLLGIPGDNTYANYREASRAFWRMTVLPLVGRTAKEFSAWLGPVHGRGLRLWYDADQIESLAEDRNAIWSRVGAADFLTEDEKREAVGYGPKERFDAKAGYRPDQPRIPRGNENGGQWTGDGGARVIRVQSGPRRTGGGPPRRIAGRTVDIPPEQATRLELSQMQMEAAVARVRELQPRWKPTPSLYETVEGQIAANVAATREAQDRLVELQRQGIGPGPFAVESQPARGHRRQWTTKEISENNRIGRKYGCHTCGTKDPGTRNGNFIGDHQDPNALNEGREQLLLPHCLQCSLAQGGYVSGLKRSGK